MPEHRKTLRSWMQPHQPREDPTRLISFIIPIRFNCSSGSQAKICVRQILALHSPFFLGQR
jgi:hypothetical protein